MNTTPAADNRNPAPASATPATATTVTGLKAERRTDGPFVATAQPRLSWKTVTAAADWVQQRTEIELVEGEGSADGRTAMLEGAASVFVAWPFEPLKPRQSVRVRVRVTGTDGGASEWSDPLMITAGFLGDGEWVARMIGAADPAEPAQPALLRHEFDVAREVRRATLYATAHGVYQAELNGTPVDDEILKPGWTSYQFRLIHETTDVAALLTPGRNAIGLSLAGGWYTEKFGFMDAAAHFYGEQPAAAAQLVLEYADGTIETVATDGSWRATAGPITTSGIYAGESYDATRELPGWSTQGFDDSGWSAVRNDGEAPRPEARTSPAVRAIEERAVERVITTPSGATILDFGQNLVGRLRIRVPEGERGQRLTLRHAEVLENGELGTRPLRNAAATDHYTLAGPGSRPGGGAWEPQFTFHGFRYAQIDGWPGDLDPTDVTAVVIHSDMPRTGWFESSSELVNRLHENVVWGMRGNFLSLPTDCPQRDERLGWTGDIQVFSPTASFLYDSDAFLASWLRDLALEQRAAGGVVPFIVPAVLGGFGGAAAAWGDAATVVPWVLYERFGDLEVLRAQYESMRSWVDTVLEIAGERHLWEGQFQFGDWLDPDAAPDSPADAKTDSDIVASAYLFRSASIVAQAAALLGAADDAEHYTREADAVRAAFQREYVTDAGRMISDAQTAYGLGIMFGLARDEAERHAMGDRLAFLVRSAGYRIGTGFVGTPLVTDALTATGHLDVAARLILQTECPSWLYPVTMGATTVWERWDSMLPDGSINPGEMTSFNHYALGAVADWLHRSVAGLGPAESGYRALEVAPHPLPGLAHARAELETAYGHAAAGWRRGDDGTLTIEAVVPPNSTARVTLPGAASPITVGSGTHAWVVADAAPALRPGPVSLGTPLADIIDDPEAYEALWRTIASHSEEAADRFRAKTKWKPGHPLASALFQLPQEARASIDTALAELNARRAS
ncbi:family 78 glycoside hydrolase catalytic domain [Microbacterium sp. STN6]|uniref:alpha-L-rhamnosidase n=1 Tax=Microbacterium sp. STN6 TaxID=2995588 RepID=UPI002260C2BC|nr:alpha-L-rhamnosidase [Microbacterium sp. STN6]MCX7522554.1 family 78 glycoside hydrolase catalytic domain [Microbacterium sp. STN6]